MSIRPKFKISNRFVFIADLVIIAATILISFTIRFEGLVFFFYLPVAYWMIGISLEYLPIEGFSLGEASGLMKGQCLLQYTLV